MTQMLDHAPVRVRAGNEEVARRARVIWRDGRLHVFRSEREAETYDAPEEPRQVARKEWRSGELTWQGAGCSCGCKVCKAPRGRLLAVVGESR